MKALHRKLLTTLLIFTTVLLAACKVQAEPNQGSISNVTLTTIGSTKSYSWNYKTIDQKGAQIKCSSYLEYQAPTSSEIQTIDLIVVVCHGTIFSNDQAPSKCGASFGSDEITSKNILIIAPDYIGYGTSVSKEHPYMVADINARTIIDAILSAINNASTFGFSLAEGYQTILCGYSQGGQTSLATLRAIQADLSSEQADLINVKKCYSGAGPHDLEATMDVFLGDWGNKAISPLIYLVVKGMLSADYDCLKGYSLSNFMTTDFLNSNLRQKIDAKNITIGDITSSYILGYEYMGFMDVANLLTAEALDSESQVHKALREALKENNLSSGWTVTTDLFLFHHKDDDMVPYVNFTKDMEGIGTAPCVTGYTDEDSFTSTPLAGDFVHGKAAANFYGFVIQELNQ